MNKKEVKKAPALRFKGFTNDWEQRKLKKLGFFYKGKGYTKKDLINNGVPILLYGELYTHYSEKISNTRLHSKLLLHSIFSAGNEVVLPDSGETSTDIARASWISNSGIILAGGLIIIKPNEYIFPGFLAYSLTYGKNHKLLASRAQGKSIVHIHANDLKTLNIIYPENLKEQQRIFALLEKLNKCIALQQRKNCLTKKIVSALSKQLTNPQFIIKCQNTQVPKKHNVLLKEIINYKNGKSHEKNQKNTGQFELVNLNSISKSGKLKTSGKYVNDTEECLKKGDIVMILSDIARGQLIGLTAVIPKDKYYVLNQRIALLHPIKKLNSVFLSSYLNNQQQYFKRVAAGMSQINISKKDVENFKLRIPDLSTQNFFGTIINQLNNFIDNNQNKSKQLIVFKEFLLQNMFI